MNLLGQLDQWEAKGYHTGLATVVGMAKSAPLLPGAAMAVNDHDEVAGSISGGCVEGAVFVALQEVIASGKPRIETYGISDEDAFAVGLSCGGTIYVLLESLDFQAPWYLAEKEAFRTQEPYTAVVVTDGPRLGQHLIASESLVSGSVGDPKLDRWLVDMARHALLEGETASVEGQGEMPGVFLEVHAPPPVMYVFGFVDFAAALTHLGKFLGYRVVVADPRAIFLTKDRFPDADEILHVWPQEVLQSRTLRPKDAICVLSHDPKIDVPAIKAALQSPVRYICALGSRKTHAKRLQILLDEGVSETELSRVSAPAGLDLGGRSAASTALSIAAELVAVQNGHPGDRLAHKTSGIHAAASR